MDSNNNVSIENSNSRNNNITMVLLALFISWKRLFKYFTKLEVTESTVLLLCWNIWYKCQLTLNAHIQFYATNLLQMRKSRLEAHATSESRAENDCLDSGIDVLENKTLHGFIKLKIY